MAKQVHRRRFGGLRVLIAGGGVAGLEAMLALSVLADGLTELELLSVEHEFWYRPLATAEPFGEGVVHRLELAKLTADVGASFTAGRVGRVDPVRHTVTTTAGLELPYDVLILACGALPRPAVPGALTFRGPADVERFRRLLDELEREPAAVLTFVQPPLAMFPLPLYELALQTESHLRRRCSRQIDLALVTHEPAPLALFGRRASAAVAALLAVRGVALHTNSSPGRRSAGRVVALPRLEAQPIPGLGRVATDEHGRVRGVDDVFAAGDITDFPVKQGGIAAQQADAVAEAIATRAGAALVPQPFRPVLAAVLLTGEAPLYLRAELDGGRATTSTVSSDPLPRPADKISARYLASFLAGYGAGSRACLGAGGAREGAARRRG